MLYYLRHQVPLNFRIMRSGEAGGAKGSVQKLRLGVYGLPARCAGRQIFGGPSLTSSRGAQSSIHHIPASVSISFFANQSQTTKRKSPLYSRAHRNVDAHDNPNLINTLRQGLANMLTPTSTFALRLAGQGAARASIASSIARTTACPYSTASMKQHQASARPIGLASTAGPIARTSAAFAASPSSSIVARVVRQPCSQRCNATAAASSAAAQQKSAPAPGDRLDWETFFQLRKSRRRWQLGFSVISGLGSFVGGAGILATGIADPLVTQIPLDPFITMGLMTMGFGALGWLIGPSVGSLVFYTLNKRWKTQMTVVSGARCVLEDNDCG